MSNQHDTEIEIQVKVERVDPLITFLKEKGTFMSEALQRDEYYTPSHRDFLSKRPICEWLRLRDAKGKFSVTYKNWYYNSAGIGTHADEYESIIADVEALRKIFDVLNFRLLISVKKRRTIWRYQDYEVSVDGVEGLGDFVEVEYKGEEKVLDVDAKIKEMIRFLKELGCGKILLNNGGYPHLLLCPHEADFREV